MRMDKNTEVSLKLKLLTLNDLEVRIKTRYSPIKHKRSCIMYDYQCLYWRVGTSLIRIGIVPSVYMGRTLN